MLFRKKNKQKPKRKSHKIKRRIGQSPGTLTFIGEKKTDSIEKEIVSYTPEFYVQQTKPSLKELMEFYSDERENWINIEGLHDTAVIKNVGKQFSLHPLLLEDVMNVEQRPKSEDFGDYIFFTIKIATHLSINGIDYEQLSFVLGKNFLISFQERPNDTFDTVKERLEASKGKLRLRKVDYLFYRLIDSVVDSYYLVLDYLADRIEELEEEVLKRPTTYSLHKLQDIKKELIYLRRSIYPVREALNTLARGENDILSEETQRYFTDVYDHAIHVIESLETYRELTGGIMDIYMNAISNRLNEVMKVLTIISTIFIPLTFIVGVYGMNFDFMPELHIKYGYPAVWAIMILIIILMLYYFKRKKWL